MKGQKQRRQEYDIVKPGQRQGVWTPGTQTGTKKYESQGNYW